MGFRDRLNKLNEEAKKVVLPPPAEEKVQKPIGKLPKSILKEKEKPPKEDKPQKVVEKVITQKEQIVWGCGCKKSVGSFLSEKCAECRAKLKAAKKKAKMATRPEGSPSGRYLKGRLPHASRFHDLVYDANVQRWRGNLTIVYEEGGVSKTVEFKDECSSIFKLLTWLDTHYRRWLDAAPVAVTVVPPVAEVTKQEGVTP